jgi:hypothetical protein
VKEGGLKICTEFHVKLKICQVLEEELLPIGEKWDVLLGGCNLDYLLLLWIKHLRECLHCLVNDIIQCLLGKQNLSGIVKLN